MPKYQIVKAVQGNNHCLHWESYELHKCKTQSYWLLKQLVHIVTIRLQSVKHVTPHFPYHLTQPSSHVICCYVISAADTTSLTTHAPTSVVILWCLDINGKEWSELKRAGSFVQACGRGLNTCRVNWAHFSRTEDRLQALACSKGHCMHPATPMQVSITVYAVS
jgi:hypothetical protein